MKKKVWIVNHYATNMYYNKNGRHYNFAKYLDKEKYDVVIVCASTTHNVDKKMEMDDFYMEISENGISWIFIKTRDYKGNGIDRVLNILDFYKNCMRLSKALDLPDIVIGSNVHLLACLFSVQMKKRHGIKSIVEIRDLWPETLLDTTLGKRKVLINALYRLEEYLYRNADAIIFTMQGGSDYVQEHYPNTVDKKKLFYINNGVDLNKFEYNLENYITEDNDLKSDKIKIVYTGSIRLFNALDRVLNLVDEVNKMGYADKVIYLIYGEGTKVDDVKKLCTERNLCNVKIKGSVEKNKVPYILNCADYTIINGKLLRISKYGTSQNKFFEYLAAGKPIFSTVKFEYDIIENHDCGYATNEQDSSKLAQQFVSFLNMDLEERANKSNNAKKAAQEFDFPVLTKKLETVLQFVLKSK